MAEDDLPSCYYRRDSDGRYRATRATVGPWSPKLQHGGPPCALLGRALEAEAAKAGLPFVARVTFAFFRPVKVAARLEVETRTVRAGSKIAHLEADLYGTVVPKSKDAASPAEATKPSKPVRVHLMRATAVASRAAPVANLPEPPKELHLSPPKPANSVATLEDLKLIGYGASMDFRLVKAVDDYLGNGPTESWSKILVGLVDGDKPLSPLERTLAFVDSAGGFSNYIPMDEYSFVNTDTTVHLLRPMQGEWCCMRARTDLSGPTGQGIASAELWDTEGFFGRVSQQQVLESKL